MSHEELVGLCVEFLVEARGLREADERLVADNAALQAQVAELRRRPVSDSSNSSRRRRRIRRTSRRRRIRRCGRKSGRKPGEQPGSPGMTRELVENPDETIPVVPSECRGCGSDLSDVPDRSVRRPRVVEAAPPPPPRVTEYQVATRVCPCCGVATTGDDAPFAAAPVVFGPRSRALTVFPATGRHVPFGRTSRVLERLCGLRCPVGAVVTACRQAAEGLEPFMTHIGGLLAAAFGEPGPQGRHGRR